MSSLLEQAIIDATALKEAALKNAEAQVLERYSTDVKEALRNLLEQEEGFTEPSATEPTGVGTSAVGMGGDQAMGGGANVRNQTPSAFRDSQKLCACPEEKEQVTIDLNLSDIEDMANEAGIPVGGNMPNPATLGPTTGAEPVGLQEEYEVNKEELLDLYEKLTVDAVVVPAGTFPIPNATEIEHAQDVSHAKKAQLAAEQEAAVVGAIVDAISSHRARCFWLASNWICNIIIGIIIDRECSRWLISNRLVSNWISNIIICVIQNTICCCWLVSNRIRNIVVCVVKNTVRSRRLVSNWLISNRIHSIIICRICSNWSRCFWLICYWICDVVIS